jgi:hypothetical protein
MPARRRRHAGSKRLRQAGAADPPVEPPTPEPPADDVHEPSG